MAESGAGKFLLALFGISALFIVFGLGLTPLDSLFSRLDLGGINVAAVGIGLVIVVVAVILFVVVFVRR